VNSLLKLVAELQEAIKKITWAYDDEHLKCLIQEVEIYTLKERIKRLEHKLNLDQWLNEK
jgi:hypothetical protein